MATKNSIDSNIPIEITKGGTAATTLTDHGVMLGSGTGAVTVLAAATTGSTLMGSTGADPSFTGSPSFSGSVTAATGLTVTTGDAAISAGNITIPATNAGGTQGVIKQGSNRVFSSFPGSNIFFGNSGNFTNSGTNNIAFSGNSLVSLTSGNSNLAIGGGTLRDCTTGSNNTSVGQSSLTNYIGGNTCVAIGNGTLKTLTSGNQNTAIGYESLLNLATGASNTGIGFDSGSAYTGAESSNIIIGNAGVAAESNVMRLGTHGAGAGQQNKCFVAGVRGITTGVADAVAVLVDSSFQLGTVSSSIRVKKNIEDMGPATDHLFDLRPVMFDFIDSKSDTDRRQYGLIAEEVEKIMPDLVVFNKINNLPESIFYHELPVMLLNEMKKMNQVMKSMQVKINSLEEEIAKIKIL